MMDLPMFNNRPAPKRPRDPLAGTRRAMAREEARHQRENMTGAEAEAHARKIIRARLQQDGDEAEIRMEHFRAANLPMDKVTQPLVRAWIRSVLDELREERS